MTKSEYMKILQEKLQRYNVAVEREILEDYEQHFAEGLAQGRTEEEIIKELGNIEDMLQEFSEEDLKQELETVEMQASQSNSYERLYRKVVIDGLLANVEVCDSGDTQLRIDYENRGSKAQKLRYYFYQYEKDGVFYAGVKDRKGIDMGNDILKGLFSHASWSCDEIDLRIEIPAGIPAIQLQTASGDMNIERIQTGELETQCSSGDLHIEGVVCEKLRAKTASGDLEISGIHLDAQKNTQVDLHTTSGDVNITDVSASHMYVQTGSGDTEAGRVQTGYLKMQTGSGELELENVQSDRIHLGTGSGDVDGRDIRGKELTVGTGSGEVALRADMETYEVKTGSGDIDLGVGAAARQIRMVAGSGDICLKLGKIEGASIETHTASGDVTLRGNRISGFKSSCSFGSGACQVKIVTGSGDISVR